MSDLYEPLRKRLRELGWKSVQRWNLYFWQSPDGGEFEEAEAFRQLQRLGSDPSHDQDKMDQSGV